MPADSIERRDARAVVRPWKRPIGRPRKMVKPAMAPRKAVSAKDIREP